MQPGRRGASTNHGDYELIIQVGNKYTETATRKIVVSLCVSMDGVAEAPEQWGFQFFKEEMTQVMTEGIAQADTVLLGRRTYLQFADLWPSQGSDDHVAVEMDYDSSGHF